MPQPPVTWAYREALCWAVVSLPLLMVWSTLMAQSKYYSPRLQYTLISPLYHAAKSKGIPMTALASSLVAEGLRRMSLMPSDVCVAEAPTVRSDPSDRYQ